MNRLVLGRGDDRHPSGSRGRLTPGDDEVLFVPIGGSDEIGMNLNLYGHAGKWLMVDCGVSFDGPESSGVDVVMPDPSFVLDHIEDVVGIVVTHAHEDHLGALPYLWPSLQAPVWCTPFSGSLLRHKLREHHQDQDIDLRVVKAGVPFDVGPFDLEFVDITHSIPEANGLVIGTGAGTVFHTGDWKLDPGPVVGDAYREDRLEAIGRKGVLALVCDSTNALEAGWSESEDVVRQSLRDLVAQQEERVVLACFASNLARVCSTLEAAAAAGRKAALAGRSLHRIVEVAQETGHWPENLETVSLKDLARLPRSQQLVLATGSQGESRAALARLANDSHSELALDEGDVIIFSSREIPGNELAIGRLKNRFVRMGVEVIESFDRPIHASGHPNRGELESMYRWIKPLTVIPVHGEARHLVAQAELAQACQVPHGIVPNNGMVIRLTEDGPEEVDQVAVGRLAVDESRLVEVGDSMLRQRRKLSSNGAVSVSVALDRKGRVRAPIVVDVVGLLDDQEEDGLSIRRAFGRSLERSMERASPRDLQRDDDVRDLLRREIRNQVFRRWQKRPLVLASVLRVDD